MAKKEKKKKGEKEKRENVGCAEEIGGRGKRESLSAKFAKKMVVAKQS